MEHNEGRVHGWMGRECRIHGGKPVKRSWRKDTKTMWMLLWSFDFILQATEETLNEKK